MKGVIIWALIVAIAAVGSYIWITGPQSYSNEPFSVSAENILSVQGQNPSHARFASKGQFRLLSDDDRVIRGQSAPVPLGMNAYAYYTAEVDNFNGTWQVLRADASLTIQAESKMITVYMSDGTKQTLLILWGILAVLIWIMGISISRS